MSTVGEIFINLGQTNSSMDFLTNSGRTSAVPSSKNMMLNQYSTKQLNYDKNLFTFKPKLNPKSALIAQNFLNFYERQNIHTQKQLEMVYI